MENFLLEAWVEEVRPQLLGRMLFDLRVDSDCLVRMDLGKPGRSLVLRLQPRQVYFCKDSDLGKGSSDLLVSAPGSFSELRGSTIWRLDKQSGDRVIRLGLQRATDQLTLVLELIPARPNLFLLDGQGTVLAILGDDRCRSRALRCGAAYVPQPERLLAPEAEFHHEPAAPRIYSSARLDPSDWRIFDPWRELLVSPIRLLSEEHRTITQFESVNAAVMRFGQLAEESFRFLKLRRQALGAIKTQILRLERSLQAAEQDCQRMEDPDRYRVSGELLLANMASLRRGDRAKCLEGEVRVIDHYDPRAREISIRIDPLKSIQENAERFFKDYRKARRGLEQQSKRRVEYQDALQKARTHVALLDAATDLATLTQLTGGVASAARVKPSPQSSIRKPQKTVGCRAYTSSDGYDILVGQSAAHNEELTFRLSKPNDLWLHVADYAGSHVIIRNPGRTEVPRRTLLEAASVAAYYSSARSQSKADVCWTQQKFVHKLKGAATGQVRLQRFKTVRVVPNQRIGKAPA